VADEAFKSLRDEIRLLREEMRREMRQSREEMRREMRESREVNRMMVAALEQQSGILRELRDSIVEMRADIVAQREGFMALVDELRRHGLGGAPA
jgi:hypothetical protein